MNTLTLHSQYVFPWVLRLLLSFSSLLMKIIISLCSILIPLSSVCLHPADMFISLYTEPSVSEVSLAHSSNLFWRSVHPVSLQCPSTFDNEVIRITGSFASLFYCSLTEKSPDASLLSYVLCSYMCLVVTCGYFCFQQGDKNITLTAELHMNHFYIVAPLRLLWVL